MLVVARASGATKLLKHGTVIGSFRETPSSWIVRYTAIISLVVSGRKIDNLILVPAMADEILPPVARAFYPNSNSKDPTPLTTLPAHAATK